MIVCDEFFQEVTKQNQIIRKIIKSKLPGIRDISIKFANIDPIDEPIPVVPSVHYMMGGYQQI